MPCLWAIDSCCDYLACPGQYYNALAHLYGQDVRKISSKCIVQLQRGLSMDLLAQKLSPQVLEPFTRILKPRRADLAFVPRKSNLNVCENKRY